MRIDKWLWTVRLFKTRTQAAEACENNKIIIDDHAVKPSRLVKPGTIIEIRRAGFTKTVEVLQLLDHRVGAKLAVEYFKDLTPKEEIDAYKARIARASGYRLPGSGRPTKKDKRDMDDFLSAIDGLFE